MPTQFPSTLGAGASLGITPEMLELIRKKAVENIALQERLPFEKETSSLPAAPVAEAVRTAAKPFISYPLNPFDIPPIKKAEEAGERVERAIGDITGRWGSEMAYGGNPLTGTAIATAGEMLGGQLRPTSQVLNIGTELALPAIGGALKKVPKPKEQGLLGAMGKVESKLPAEMPRLETSSIKFSEPVTVRDVSGAKKTITPEPNMFISKVGKNYEIHDGQTVKVRPNVAQDFKGRYGIKEIKGEFAPELKEVEETIKGVESTYTKELKELNERAEALHDKAYEYASTGQKVPPDLIKEGDLIDKQANILKEKFRTKFSQYQLPGGENYREVLIQAPLKARGSDIIDLKAIRSRATHPRQVESEVIGGFRSSHWDEPNVLAHLRMNDRVTPKGEKVTFIEELQSDWAAKGRKEGFLQESVKDLPQGTKITNDGKTYIVEIPQSVYGRNLFYGATKGEAVENAKSFIAQPSLRAVPSHPLLKNWQELSLKRALKEAVDNNSDYLAWTSGEQQAARYDLSKQVDKIIVRKSADDSGYHIIGEKGDTRVIGTKVTDLNDLEKYIGKDLGKKAKDYMVQAETNPKINPYEGHEYSGLDLKIGGEWAKNLYDKQVPNILKDLTGQNVEVLKMPTGTQQAIRITPEIGAMVRGEKKGEFSALKRMVKGEK